MSRTKIIIKKRELQFTKLTIFLFLIVTTHLLCISNLKENNYNVGFRFYEEFDTTRLYTTNQDTTFRPLLINFWYPSKVGIRIKVI